MVLNFAHRRVSGLYSLVDHGNAAEVKDIATHSFGDNRIQFKRLETASEMGTMNGVRMVSSVRVSSFPE